MVTNALQLSGALLTMLFILREFTEVFGKSFIHSNITYVVAKVNGKADKVGPSLEAGLVLVGMVYIWLSYNLPPYGGENLWLEDSLYSMYVNIVGNNVYLFGVVKFLVFNSLVALLTGAGIVLGKPIGKRLLYRELDKKKR
ncbi:hypothetical protein [Bacillus toyonensis]|uniref:hypothetical protein n=1 Tax=Bacillus toyonensis TaxID=155322 RepID=UPI002E247D1D|nr:hypothetical protein [Bacillus toyonensis]